MKIHIVQKGDTLWKIAKKYGVNFEELKKMNSQLSNPDMIMPGMKIKVPTTGGTIKKHAPTGSHTGTTINLGVKKEMPIAEHPFAKEKPYTMPIAEAPKKEVPIKEAPIKKEAPIMKEAPKVPYIPKMPLKIVPEIDINNYYMTNMSNMVVQQPQLPPKPANILPEVKEVPKKEMPIAVPPPPAVKPAAVPPPVVEQPPMPQEYCVPITPVMPGPGFCPPPMWGFPSQPMMPCAPVQQAPMPMENMPMPMENMPMTHGTFQMGAAPTVAGTSYIQPGFGEESSSFMPQMPMMHQTQPGAVMGMQNPAMQTPYMDQAGFSQMPGAYGQMPSEYGQMPGAYGQMPAGFGQMPGAHGQMPSEYGQMPGAYSQMPSEYGQMPGAYGQMPGAHGQMPAGFGQMPGTYGQMPGGYGQMPGAYGQMPGAYGQMPGGFEESPGFQSGFPGGAPAGYQTAPSQGGFAQQSPVRPGTGFENQIQGTPYGQIPYGYPQVTGATQFEPAGSAVGMQQSHPPQSLPVGTGALGDCGCGAPVTADAPPNFVPPTPPIYSAPYTAPVNTAQPPFMYPYGMGPMDANPYGMQRFEDESNEYGS